MIRLLALAFLLTGCGVDLLAVKVEPEKKACQDSTVVIGQDSVYKDPRPGRMCETGGVVTKWVWE